MSEARCESCRFWPAKRETYGTYGLHGPSTDGSVSDCRRHSPRDVQDATPRYAANAVWPQTRREDWCGEYEPIQLQSTLE